ncbi:MAG: hypothetical protein CVU89_01630 [Firmicutes bacterium HGW-Firmicutes-14]|nr:MAG: hypothetical protein CVU89_01630 [Firmicutes bacterium HGW-Firmicutes-14]
MLIDLLFILAVRFFLFDFILFKKVREYLGRTHYVFRKLFSCTFCQGFWCGLIFSLLSCQGSSFGRHIEFSFVSAIITFTWTVLMHRFIKEYEDEYDLPMT